MTGSKLTWIMLLATFATAAVACGVSANQGKAAQNSGDENAESQEFPKAQTAANYDMPVGSEITLCDGCPTFVKVPAAPDNLRNIQYVSKYELTWKNYMMAYDDGACSIPDLWNRKARLVTANPDLYRVDWPIDVLQPKDIKCYFDWLSQKSNYKFDIPTEAEWTWFAYAGATTKYPWGDEIDLSKIAIVGPTTKVEDYTPQPYNYGARNIRGLKVGLFPPNNWGLYDVGGNLRELTKTSRSGGELSIADAALASSDGQSLAIMGYNWYIYLSGIGHTERQSEDIANFKLRLAKNRFNRHSHTGIKNGKFNYTPALRMIIVGGQ